MVQTHDADQTDFCKGVPRLCPEQDDSERIHFHDKTEHVLLLGHLGENPHRLTLLSRSTWVRAKFLFTFYLIGQISFT